MSFGLIISSIALGVSLLASAIKLVDWLAHADPRAVVRAGRWLLFFLAIASIPCLVVLLVYQQWALAMMLGAGMLVVPTMAGWRLFPLRLKLRPIGAERPARDAMRGDFDQPPDPELARRAAVILEAYLARAGRPEIDAGRRAVAQEEPPSGWRGPISAGEALEILVLEPGARAAAIRAAHRRLLQLVHPDRGGTNYLAAQINRAKETLLAEAAQRPRASKRAAARDE